MAGAPAFITKGAFDSGSAAIAPGIPGSPKVDDLLVLFVENANQATATPTGWTAASFNGDANLAVGSAGAATGTRLDIFYRRFQTGDAAPSVADTGDHTTGIILNFRFAGIHSGGTPFEFGATSAYTLNNGSTTTLTAPAYSTGGPLRTVIFAVASGHDAASTSLISSTTDGNLTGTALQHQQTVATGAGGGLALFSGTLTAAGATGGPTMVHVSAAVGERAVGVIFGLVPSLVLPPIFTRPLRVWKKRA